MQAFNQKYDYGKRAEYQVARLETTYLKSGSSWEKAPTVFQISVLDFTYNKDEEDSKKVVSRYAMRTAERDRISGLEASRKEGLAQGIAQNRVATAKKLLSMGIAPEQVAEGTGLALDEVINLKD
ncbi:MAG: hypothetical protein IKQ66_04890 [Treponema sp.]|nr:hypothetical protein [Treponema sp.]MBR6193481.1 hypothetical protein [Treponema sp.]